MGRALARLVLLECGGGPPGPPFVFMLNEGDYVTHRDRPEWGIGRVVGFQADGKCRIEFAAAGSKIFAASALDRFTVVDPPAATSKRSKTSASSTSERARPCASCGEPLNRSRYSPSRDLKSCPECSVRNGSHVFRPYPDAFGTSEMRASDEEPEGPQSYCSACRRGTVSTEPAKTCNEVTGTS